MLEWWRRWRRKRAATKRRLRLREGRGETELREFVYLDTTSVHSLITSRLGPIATEQTENEAREWESRAAGKVGTDLAFFDLSASAERTRGGSQSVQVLKKSIIQTTFKDLLELEGDTLLLGGSATQALVPSIKLLRGSLVEFDVELDVEPVFRVATVVSSMVGFVEKSPELFDAAMHKQFAQGRALEGMLRGLLGGLVPIRARVLNYTVVPHRDGLAVARIDASTSNIGEALFLVGVAEEQLFWTDIRRVLFSGGRYKILARIAEDGIRDSWTPIKLGHVLEQIIPGFSTQMADWDTLVSRNASAELPLPEPRLKQALFRFIELVSEQAGADCSAERVSSARSHVETLQDSALVYDAWKAEAAKVTKLLLAHDQATLSPDDLATLREAAKTSVPRREDVRRSAVNEPHGTQPKHFIDCEIVAIYW